VANAIFKQEHLLHELKGGQKYIDLLFELIESEALQVIRSSQSLMRSAYELAEKHNDVVYDCVFVVLALRLGVELKTHDGRQERIMGLERPR
jgi:predicted nucleic acid-binding protein